MVRASPTSRGFGLLTLNAYNSANSEPIDFEFSLKFAEKFGLSFGLLGEVLTVRRLVRLRIITAYERRKYSTVKADFAENCNGR